MPALSRAMVEWTTRRRLVGPRSTTCRFNPIELEESRKNELSAIRGMRPQARGTADEAGCCADTLRGKWMR